MRFFTSPSGFNIPKNNEKKSVTDRHSSKSFFNYCPYFVTHRQF